MTVRSETAFAKRKRTPGRRSKHEQSKGQHKQVPIPGPEFSVTIFLILFISYYCCCCFNVVTAISDLCSVEDMTTGEQITLIRYRMDDKIPPGVHYNPQANKLSCLTAKSCQDWRISGCTSIYCQHSHACRRAQFVGAKATLQGGNQGIACWGTQACQEAEFIGAHDVSCGAGFSKSCYLATIETDSQLWCYGPGACQHVTVNVGSDGFVRCANGKGEKSCQDLKIIIDHGLRACIGINPSSNKNCAVVCGTAEDCDKATILFEVAPS